MIFPFCKWRWKCSCVWTILSHTEFIKDKKCPGSWFRTTNVQIQYYFNLIIIGSENSHFKLHFRNLMNMCCFSMSKYFHNLKIFQVFCIIKSWPMIITIFWPQTLDINISVYCTEMLLYLKQRYECLFSKEYALRMKALLL